MKFDKRSILYLILVMSIFNCNVIQNENKDNNLLAIIAFSLVGTGGSCTINVLKGGRNTTASANPVLITSTEKSISYSKVPVVTHSIGIAQISSASQGDVIQFSAIDVADFDGDSTDSLPLCHPGIE